MYAKEHVDQLRSWAGQGGALGWAEQGEDQAAGLGHAEHLGIAEHEVCRGPGARAPRNRTPTPDPDEHPRQTAIPSRYEGSGSSSPSQPRHRRPSRQARSANMRRRSVKEQRREAEKWRVHKGVRRARPHQNAHISGYIWS